MSRLSKLNISAIVKILGLFVIIEGLFMILAIPVSIFYNEKDIKALILSSSITIFFGVVLFILNYNKNIKNIGKREGYIIVSLTWIIISIFGSLPFYFSSVPEFGSFTNCFFETISGFTTTGASILNDIEAVPKGLLFWRSLTHWIGGMGIIVLSIAILPILGIGGMQLYAAEVPGPTHDKIHPKITETAKRIWAIYIILTIAQTVLLYIGGMNLFDSICHSFGTMATGGFSTKNTSLIEYSSYIQYIVIIFMFLAGVNFSLHYFLLKGMFLRVFKNEELKFYITIIGVFTLFITLGVYLNNNSNLEKSFRDALFQVVSIITTTGFVSANYLNWLPSVWFILFLLMFFGGCAGSTGGGIKIIRLLMLFKNSKQEFKRIIHPNAIIPVRLNKKPVSKETIFNIQAFFLTYLGIFILGAVSLSLVGLDFESAIGASISSLGNIGPAIGKLGPVDNYFYLSDIGKWILSFLMLAGRLELFSVLILFSFPFWWK